MLTPQVRVEQNRMRGQLQQAIKSTVRDLRIAIAHEVEATWKTRAPVDTGAYRGSIHTIEDATKTTSIVTTDVPGDDPYDIYQEYGTEDTAAHPAARPAAEQHRQAYKGRAAQAVEDATS